MPIYEYRCEECDHRFEIIQRLGGSSDGLNCPSCGAPELEKMFSTFAASTQGASATSASAAGCGPGAFT